MVELDERVCGGVGPMSGQWPVPGDRCGDATREVQITHDQGRGLALLHMSGHPPQLNEIAAGKERQVSARHPHEPMWRLDVGDQRHSGFFADDGSASGAGKREGEVRAGPRHPQHFPAADGVAGE